MILNRSTSKEVSLAIEDILRKCAVGEMVTHQDLDQVPGFNRHLRRGPRTAAIARLEREGICFRCEIGAGYRRLEPSQIDSIGRQERAKVGRGVRRKGRAIGAALSKFNDITNDAKLKLLREQTALGMIDYLSKDRIVAKVDQITNRPLPLRKAAEALLSHINGG